MEKAIEFFIPIAVVALFLLIFKEFKLPRLFYKREDHRRVQYYIHKRTELDEKEKDKGHKAAEKDEFKKSLQRNRRKKRGSDKY